MLFIVVGTCCGWRRCACSKASPLEFRGTRGRRPPRAARTVPQFPYRTFSTFDAGLNANSEEAGDAFLRLVEQDDGGVTHRSNTLVERKPARVQERSLAGLGTPCGVGLGQRCLAADVHRSELGDPASHCDGGGGDGSSAGGGRRQAPSSATPQVVARNSGGRSSCLTTAPGREAVATDSLGRASASTAGDPVEPAAPGQIHLALMS